ncbi:MAG: cation:proton antiporter [Spirochaetes bacterium]|nr:cation:proton antiporter [Spirochaetota bacterium]
MPESFDLALYSILVITAGGVISIALARASRVHPAFFFLACGVVAGIYLPFSFPAQSLLLQLSELGALFVIFLSALEIEWDLHFAWRGRTILAAFALQLMVALPVAAIFFFVLKADALTAIAVASIAAVHAPERRQSIVSESFRASRVSSDIAFMGLISEITALLAVSLLVAYAQRATATGDLLQEAVGAMLIMLILISFIPASLRFLVRRVGEDSYALFYLMLVLLIAVTIAVRKAGIEPLIGAYAAGFVLTRFVAEGSRVLERLRFTGHSIIVPAFYIQLGISSNFTSSFQWTTLLTALAILAASLIARAAFAFVMRATRRDAKISLRQLMRKNPLVLVLLYVAYARGILPIQALHSLMLYAILNEIFVVVLARFSRPEKIVHSEDDASRILLPVSNPETMLPLLTLAGHFRPEGEVAKIFPLNVVPDTPEAAERIRSVEAQFNELKPLYSMRDDHIELTARIENDRIKAVAHAARELLTEKILLGLGAIPTLQKPQGYSFLEQLTETAPANTVIAAHIQTDLSLSAQINVIVANARLLTTQDVWLPAILALARRLKANPVFFAEPEVLPAVTEHLAHLDPRRRYSVRAGQIHAGLDLLTLNGGENALWVAVLERAAYYPQEKIHARLPEMMLRAFADRNFMLIYPAGEMPRRKVKKRGNAWVKFRRFFGFS